jgi:hypothetical protein
MPANSELVILQNQHAALGLFRADHVAGLQHQPFDVAEFPQRRLATALRLARHQVLEHLPQRRHVELGDLVIIGFPRSLHIVLGAGTGLLCCCCDRHERAPFKSDRCVSNCIAQFGVRRNTALNLLLSASY